MRAPALFVLCAVVSALYLALTGGRAGGPLSAGLLLLHMVAPAVALALLRGRVSPRIRLAAGTAGLLSLVGGLGVLLPGLPQGARAVLVAAHVCAGAAALALPSAALLSARFRFGRTGVALAALVLLLGPAGLYLAGERAALARQPPRYEAAACYRFLTATTAAQSGSGAFPTALRTVGELESGCEQSGCHGEIAGHAAGSAHARGAAGAAYRATLADFTARRGETAARWCRGCHEPEPATRSVGCLACHAATEVHAGYGAAALTLSGHGSGQGKTPPLSALDVRLRPYSHAARFSQRALLRSAEFCGSCHRKHWSLPQNEYRWMEGPDELRGWQGSHFSGAALFAPGDARPARSCVGCHDPHGGATAPRDRPIPLTLDLHVRLASPSPQLDVVVHNGGIGHDFPYGMPDLHEAWLEVTLFDARGRMLARSGGVDAAGRLDPQAHVYRLVALDRRGAPIRHGRLDEMVAVREWRRIAAGQSDLARYALPAGPPRGSRLVVRLLRRRRPDFSAWAGEPPVAPQVVAEAALPLPAAGDRPASDPAALRRYGTALAAVKAYPEALRVLLAARGIDAADAETDLALGRVYLLEGDLLAAQDAFLRVAARPVGGGEPGLPSHDRARAWEAAVLRRTGRHDEAARALAELARRYPRDRQLRFELGLTRMALLDHAGAAREFQAALDVDPLDAASHYNLMISQQRLNQLTRARREETVYRLLSDTAPLPVAQPQSPAVAAVEATPLHVHPLEPVR